MSEREPTRPIMLVKRPDNVPSDAEPFVGWVGWDGNELSVWSPNGSGPGHVTPLEIWDWGYPFPPPRAPLAELAREHADRLNQLADDLEAQ